MGTADRSENLKPKDFPLPKIAKLPKEVFTSTNIKLTRVCVKVVASRSQLARVPGSVKELALGLIRESGSGSFEVKVRH